MKKTDAKFLFDKTYINSLGEMKIVVVQLCVDYEKQSFTIYPSQGKEFCFVGVSQNFEKWKAITFAINEAIDYATVELGLKKEDTLGDSLDERDPILDKLLRDTNLRARHGLDVHLEVKTVGELINLSRNDLLKIRNFGKVSLTEIENFLHKHNLKLKGE